MNLDERYKIHVNVYFISFAAEVTSAYKENKVN